MEADATRVQCMSVGGRSNSLGEASVKMNCFGFGRKKAKPIQLPKEEPADEPTDVANTPEERLSKHSGAIQSRDAAVEKALEARCGDASPRTWNGLSSAKHFFGGTSDGMERSDSARHTSEDEGAQAESVSEEAENLTMHDSTSSLKEGLHGKNKTDLHCARNLAHKEALEEEEEDDENILQPEWEINPHDIYFCSRSNGKLSRLGKGAFGTVYKGMWMDQPVAVKVCRQQHLSIKAMKQFQKEVSILYGCKHDNIVQFKGACCWKGGKRTVLVTEYMEKGDLCTALGRSPSRYSWARLGRTIALDVARGLAFLHAMNVVHFDLKSANILLDKECRAKLADVGLAKTLTHYYGSDQLSTFMATGDLGTFAWAAPEVLLGFPCDAKADIFSFGVVMWELATTEMPQGRCLRPIRVPEEASEKVADLIMDCLRHDATARPTAEQLVEILGSME